MNSVILVPDTGILLAVGFGDDVDPKAPAASQALSRALGAGIRVVAPPSVALELNRKLDELDTIYSVLQEATRGLSGQTPSPSGLEAAEEALLEVRKRAAGKAPRYFEAIEREISRAVVASPTAALEAVFAYVAGMALLLKEAVRTRSRPASVEFPAEPQPDYTPIEPRVANVRGMDAVHLRACQSIGERENSEVVFLVFERPVYGRKKELEGVFPRVRITNPSFVSMFLTRR